MKHSKLPKGIVKSVLVGVVVSALVLSGCGDDDDTSPEAAFCNAGNSLEQSLDALVNLDVVASGTDGLTEAFDNAKSDLDGLKSAGAELAEDEINALNDAVGALESAIDSVGDDGINAGNAEDVLSSMTAVGTSASVLYSKLDTTCGA